MSSSKANSNGKSSKTPAPANTVVAPANTVDYPTKGDNWYHGGTKDKVAGQTGAAKDELLTFDNADVLTLDVLANDPGSAYIWTIDQDALAGPDSNQVVKDHDSVTLTSGAILSVNPDGTLSYLPPASIANLPEGQTFTDTFTYVIRMAKGALSTAQATVTINGTHGGGSNTPATFSGDLSGTVTEDGATAVVSGTLVVQDPDANQAKIASTGSLQGTYGQFSFDTATGAWTYTLDNARDNVDVLKTGETRTDTLSLQSVDGTQTQLTITINGDTDFLWKLDNVNNEASQYLKVQTNGVLSYERTATPAVALTLYGSGPDGIFQIEEFTRNDVVYHPELNLGTTTEFGPGEPFAGSTGIEFSAPAQSTAGNVDVLLIDFVGLTSANLIAQLIPVPL